MILTAPYNPVFRKNLYADFPVVYQNHLAWIEKLKALHIPQVRVIDYFSGIPGDDGSVRFWNDGVHFTCKGAEIMLRPELNRLK